MIPVTFIQWGGQAGAGFAPVLDDSQPEPPQSFQALADEYVRNLDGVPQPPTEVPDIAAHPALGIRMAHVPGYGEHWCFSVQVKGGSFGRTGICQFLFAAAEHTEPARVWEYCAGLVADNDGVLPGSIAVDGLPDNGAWRPSRHRVRPSVDTIADVLTDLTDGYNPIRINGSTAEVVAAIGGLLSVVPGAVARERVWTTYLLVVPGDRRFRFVSGLWPEELRGEDPAVRVTGWLSPASALVLATTRQPEFEQAIEWLAGQASSGTSLHQYHDLPSMAALVDEVRGTVLAILRPAEVPAALERRDARVLLPENRTSVASWVRTAPDSAIGMLCDGMPDPLADAVFGALVEAHLAAPALNLSRLPPRSCPDSRWPVRSTVLLLRRYPDAGSRAAFVREALTGPGMPLAGTEARAAARDWFTGLGLDEDDPALADLFPVTVERAAREFALTGTLGPLGVRYLRSGEPVPALKALIDRLGAVTPVMAMELARGGGDAVGVSQVLRAAIVHNEQRHAGFGGTVTDWLMTAISLGTSPTEKEAVLHAGRAALRKAGETPGPAATVLFGRTAVTVLPDEAQPYREILLELASLAETAVAERNELVLEIASARQRADELEKLLRQSAMEVERERGRLVALESAQHRQQDKMALLRQRYEKDLAEKERWAEDEIARVDQAWGAEQRRLRKKLEQYEGETEQYGVPDPETVPEELPDSRRPRFYEKETWPRTRNHIILALLILLVVGAVFGGIVVVVALT